MQSENKDVGFPFTDNRGTKLKERWDKYNRLKRHLRGQSGKPVFPIGKSNKGNFETQAEPQNKRERIRCKNPSDIAGSLRVGGGDTKDLIASTLAQRDYKGGNNLIQVAGNPAKGGTGALTSTEHCFTLDKHPHLVINQIKTEIRRLTPTECERLQGYPDGWTAIGSDGIPISDTQRYKTIGNAVTTTVIKAVMETLKHTGDTDNDILS